MKRIYIAAAMAAAAVAAHADIVIKFPASLAGKEVTVVAQDIETLSTARNRSDIIAAADTIAAAETVTVKDMLSTPARYRVEAGDDARAMFFAAPGQNITIDLTNPEMPVMTGSALIEQLSEFNSRISQYERAYMEARKSGDDKAMEQAVADYNGYVANYIENNTDSEFAPYVITEIDDPEQLMAAFGRLGENAKSSILMPLAAAAASRAEKQIEKDRLQAALTGNAAPDFKLPDLDGNMKSLADYRGKWVILDFWGSWCPWCIKGFPELKELYAKYAPDTLEIIGIDCREDDAAWRKGVETHALPWVQLYNSADAGTENLFGVSGYPTKVIIDPEGKVAKVVVGHTSDFTPTLEALMGK